MKKMTVMALGVCCVAALATSTTSAAIIQEGDVIKLDFSTAGDGDGGSLADWNQVHTGLNTGGIGAGSVIRHGDGAVIDGASISFANLVVNNFNNDGNSGNWGGTGADPYYILGADDIYFGPGALTTTFKGLSAGLTYNVRVYSLIGNNGGATETITVDVNQASVTNSRGSRWSAATLEAGGTVFTGLQVTNSDEIVVTVQNASGGGGFYPLNAIVIEAVPEPSSVAIWGVLALAFAGAGYYRMRRKK